MPTPVNRQTVDLSQYPNLVVIYLGMRVNRTAGLKTLVRIWAEDFRLRRSPTPRLVAARELCHFAFPHARRHAAVLDGYGVAAVVVAIGTASRLVEELPSRLRRHRLLA